MAIETLPNPVHKPADNKGRIGLTSAHLVLDPGAAAPSRCIRDRLYFHVDRLHDVNTLLLAVMDSEEGGHCGRLARMASATVREVIGALEAMSTLKQEVQQ